MTYTSNVIIRYTLVDYHIHNFIFIHRMVLSYFKWPTNMHDEENAAEISGCLVSCRQENCIRATDVSKVTHESSSGLTPRVIGLKVYLIAIPQIQNCPVAIHKID